MKEPQEIFSGDQLTGPAYVERSIRWPGGRGILTAQFDNESGATAKITVGWVGAVAEHRTGASGWSLQTPALSVGGVTEMTASGDYLVELPPCFIQFIVQLDAGHTLTLPQVTIVPMEQ